jgi:multiple sugar transport system substrate-binding protein
MTSNSRREFLSATAAGAAAVVLGVRAHGAEEVKFTPERDAKLRVLRWKRFVQGDEDQWLANTRRFTQATGVPVQVDSENWEEVRPKAAVAANVGAGPDIVIATDEDPHQYPERLLDVSDLAEYLGRKYQWFDVCRDYGTHEGKWMAIPTAAAGGAMVYRNSLLQEAGFAAFPNDCDGFLKLCQVLKAKGAPCGLALGHATGDANAWCNWLLWGFGGKLTDASSRVAINSRETLAALEYAKALYATFIPGTASWLDPSNNKAFLAGEIGVTLNGISIYYAARTSPDPKVRSLAADIGHALYPLGPAKSPTRSGLMFPGFVFRYTRYPNAATHRSATSRTRCAPTSPIRYGQPIRNTAIFATWSSISGTSVMRASWAVHRPPPRPTSWWWTCSPKPAPASSRRRRRPHAPSGACAGTIAARAMRRCGCRMTPSHGKPRRARQEWIGKAVPVLERGAL